MYVHTNIHRYIHIYTYTCIYTYVYRSIYVNVSMRDSSSMPHSVSLMGHSRVYRRAHVYRDKKVEGQRGRKDVGQRGARSEEMGGG